MINNLQNVPKKANIALLKILKIAAKTAARQAAYKSKTGQTAFASKLYTESEEIQV